MFPETRHRPAHPEWVVGHAAPLWVRHDQQRGCPLDQEDLALHRAGVGRRLAKRPTQRRVWTLADGEQRLIDRQPGAPERRPSDEVVGKYDLTRIHDQLA